MNPNNYQTFTFALTDNNEESREVIDNDVNEALNVSNNRRREWDIRTENLLLHLIIEEDTYHKLSKTDSYGKNSLWNSLHNKFCNHPDVIQYASTPAGHTFKQKYKNVQYTKDKFTRIKTSFRKITAEIKRTGSGGPPPNTRYEHFDDMKDITMCDPSFWPPMLVESARAGSGSTSRSTTHYIQSDNCSYQATYFGEARFIREAYSRQISSVSPAPTPAPPAPPEPSAMAEGRGRLRINEAIERLVGNSTRVNANVEEGLSRMLGEFRQTRGLVEVAVEDMRRRDEAASEARRLDRQMWERIAETDFELREKEMRCREKIAELKRLSRQTSSQSSSSNNTNK